MLTVAQARTRLARYVNPVNPNDADFLRQLNMVLERLVDMGEWKGTRTTATFTPTGGVISLAANQQSLLGIHVGSAPRTVVSDFYDFNPGGSAYIGACSHPRFVVDMGIVGGVQKYRLGWQPEPEVEVVGLVRLRHVWLTTENAAVYPDSTPALMHGLLGFHAEEELDSERADRSWAKAYEILDKQAAAQRGSAAHIMSYNPNGVGVSAVKSYM